MAADSLDDQPRMTRAASAKLRGDGDSAGYVAPTVHLRHVRLAVAEQDLGLLEAKAQERMAEAIKAMR